MKLNALMPTLGICILFSAPAAAQVFQEQLREMATQKFQSWVRTPAIIDAVKAQNQRSASLSQEEIDAQDKQWRAEAKAGGGPVMEPVMKNPISDFLRARQLESEGLYSEIFIMDARGLNVAASVPTSDYWQGDEAKWKKTFPLGAGTIFYDELDYDQSTGSFQTQVSVTVDDPATGTAIGAMTVGVSFESSSVDKMAYGEFLAAECTICHQITTGRRSSSVTGAPVITGLEPADFAKRFEAQRKSRNAVMRDIVATQTGFDVQALGVYLASVAGGQ